MKKKEEEIIRYLLSMDQKVTANELSLFLDCSIRSIKTYIANINYKYSDLVSSTNRGYLINKKQAKKIIHEKKSIPQDYEGRCIFLIKRSLIERAKTQNIYSLSEELFISESTLKNDIQLMNTSFTNFNLSFSCKKDRFIILGEEKNKRKLISHVMSEEVKDNFLDFSVLQKSFPEYNLTEISEEVKLLFKNENYYINDFSFINLLLHIVIMVNRIQLGNHIQNRTPYNTIKSQTVSIKLCAKLEKFFDINFNEHETFEINLLVNASINFNLNNDTCNKQLEDVVPVEIINLALELIERVDQQYFINLNSSSFITPFALHLKNLKTRLDNNITIQNPMHDNIKISCPMIYDISTYLSYELAKRFKSKINKDEIAFLALHVGNEIERQKKNEFIVKCVLLCPEYLQLSETLYNKLLFEFGEKIEIICSISFEYEIPKDFDLLITTIPSPESDSYLTITLPPLMGNYDTVKIHDAISKIENKKKSHFFSDSIQRYFSKDLYYSIDADRKITKMDVIKLLSNKMVTLGYVEPNFEKEVIKREAASSTAFLNVAIPHPMKMTAYKTCVAVLVSKQGIKWDDSHVIHVVFLIAFNQIDNHHFHQLYESLIHLFNETNIVDDIKKCTNIDAFTNVVINSQIEKSTYQI